MAALIAWVTSFLVIWILYAFILMGLAVSMAMPAAA